MMQDLENECRIAVAKVYQLSDDNKALRARVAELEKQVVDVGVIAMTHPAQRTASEAMHERDIQRMRVKQWKDAYEDLRLVAVRAVQGVTDLSSAPDRGGADRIVREDALNELDELFTACSRATPCDPADI